jgi:hypothetical protein
MHHMTAAWSRLSAVSGGLGMRPGHVAAYSPLPAAIDRSPIPARPASRISEHGKAGSAQDQPDQFVAPIATGTTGVRQS